MATHDVPSLTSVHQRRRPRAGSDAQKISVWAGVIYLRSNMDPSPDNDAEIERAAQHIAELWPRRFYIDAEDLVLLLTGGTDEIRPRVRPYRFAPVLVAAQHIADLTGVPLHVASTDQRHTIRLA